MEATGGSLHSFPWCPLCLSLSQKQVWGGSEGDGGSSASAMVPGCWLGPRVHRLWRRGPFLPMLEMGPRKLPLASSVGRAGGSMHCRYCEVCRFHSAGICHLANSQVSAIPVRVAAASTAHPHDEVPSQVLAMLKVWQSWFLQGASGEHCDRGPCAGPAGCRRRGAEGTLDS